MTQPKTTKKPTSEDRLEKMMASIRSEFGDDAVFAGDAVQSAHVDTIPSGSINLDRAIGVGGIPRGRSVEIFGPESSGKSTLALSTMAQAQKMGLTAVYIDTEHAMVPEWAEKVGLDLSKLIISQPESAEQALNICRRMIKSNLIGVVVLDSVAAMATSAELEKDIGDATVAAQARMMSQALRNLCHDIFTSRASLIFINQIRENINATGYAPKEVTSGGRALKFYASLRIDLRRIESVKHGEANIGNRVRARVVKNKVSAPFRTAEFEILFDRGIDQVGEYIDQALKQGHISRKGSHYYRQEVSIGNGREMMRNNVRDDPELLEAIKTEVMAGLNAEK